MIFDLSKNIMKYTIFLGLIGIFVYSVFGLQRNYIQINEINGFQVYTFQWYKYLDTVNNAWETYALNFQDIIPSRTWQDPGTIFNGGVIMNNIALIFDWIYFPINLILWILRWIAWILKMVLALIGWDFSYTLDYNLSTQAYDKIYNSAFVTTLTWITQNLMIPYL